MNNCVRAHGFMSSEAGSVGFSSQVQPSRTLLKVYDINDLGMNLILEWTLNAM